MQSNASAILAADMLRGSLNSLSPTAETVSPITLSSEWSRVGRLLLLTALSVTGSIGNVFMISSIMIEDDLKKKGNAFLASLVLSDSLVTGIVMPSSVVVILADITDSSSAVCNFQWFLILLSCLVSVLSLLVIAMENHFRLCLSPECYSLLTPCKITFTIIMIWILSCTIITIQTFFGLGPDYCTRKTQGDIEYQTIAGLALVLVPLALTLLCYLYTFIRVSIIRSSRNFRPPVAFIDDYDLMKSNLLSFIFCIIFWTPFSVVIAVNPIQIVSPKMLYTLAWFALTKSCILNFLYCITNCHFRSAYIRLFHYCCCKTSSFSRRPREPVRPSGDVRVHIIPGYNMYSYTSPQRSRDTGTGSNTRTSGGVFRSSASRSSNRDVYEL